MSNESLVTWLRMLRVVGNIRVKVHLNHPAVTVEASVLLVAITAPLLVEVSVLLVVTTAPLLVEASVLLVATTALLLVEVIGMHLTHIWVSPILLMADLSWHLHHLCTSTLLCCHRMIFDIP